MSASNAAGQLKILQQAVVIANTAPDQSSYLKSAGTDASKTPYKKHSGYINGRQSYMNKEISGDIFLIDKRSYQSDTPQQFSNDGKRNMSTNTNLVLGRTCVNGVRAGNYEELADCLMPAGIMEIGNRDSNEASNAVQFGGSVSVGYRGPNALPGLSYLCARAITEQEIDDKSVVFINNEEKDDYGSSRRIVYTFDAYDPHEMNYLDQSHMVDRLDDIAVTLGGGDPDKTLAKWNHFHRTVALLLLNLVVIPEYIRHAVAVAVAAGGVMNDRTKEELQKAAAALKLAIKDLKEPTVAVPREYGTLKDHLRSAAVEYGGFYTEAINGSNSFNDEMFVKPFEEAIRSMAYLKLRKERTIIARNFHPTLPGEQMAIQLTHYCA
jgi:hypothetical protein